MLIKTPRHEKYPTMLLKLNSRDLLEVRAPEGGPAVVTLSRPNTMGMVPLAEYATEDRAEEVLLEMARFSARLMMTDVVDPLYIMPAE